MVAISFSFLFCLSQKLWEEEEMKALSIGKQDNKFYEWFYVCFVTETENLNQNLFHLAVGTTLGVENFKNWRWQQLKQRSCWVFMTVKIMQQKLKTTQVPRTSVVESINFRITDVLRKVKYRVAQKHCSKFSNEKFSVFFFGQSTWNFACKYL